MKYSKEKKRAVAELKDKKEPLSPRKKKLIRVLAELGATLLGGILIILSKVCFEFIAVPSAEKQGVLAITRDNFELYFKLSGMLCGILLLLTLLSAFTYLFQKDVGRFQRLVVSASPLICSAAVISTSAFYSYLTTGIAVSIIPYLIVLGLGQALVFRLPCAMYVLFRKK